MIRFLPVVEVTVMDQAELVGKLATLKEMTGVDYLVDLMAMVLESPNEVGSAYLVTGHSGEVHWTDDLDIASDAMEDEGEMVTAHWRKAVRMGDVEVITA